MEIIVVAAILDFNRKWIFFGLPPYLKLKILQQTKFVPSFMLVPQKAVFFDILQLSAGLRVFESSINVSLKYLLQNVISLDMSFYGVIGPG